MKRKRFFRLILILTVLIFIVFKGFKVYLYSDGVPHVSSLTKELEVKNVMFIFAHPDDETYTTQVLTDAQNEGIETTLLTFTPGDAGEQQPQVCQQQFLGDIRKAEVLKSGFVLGVDHQKVFSYGDGTLKNLDINLLISDIKTELERFQPDLVITFWPESGITMHDDHRTIGKATQLAVAEYRKQSSPKSLKLGYAIMPSKVLSVLAQDEINHLQPDANYSINAKARIKTRLWKIHASQRHFVKNYTGLPDWLLYRLLSREYYFIE